MPGEKALRRWFEEKRAVLTAQVSSLGAERNRILNELEDIDSLLERERLRLEILDEFAADAEAFVSKHVTPTDAETASVESEPSIKGAEALEVGRVKSSSDDPKRFRSAAVGRVRKDKKVQEIVQEIVEQVEGSDST